MQTLSLKVLTVGAALGLSTLTSIPAIVLILIAPILMRLVEFSMDTGEPDFETGSNRFRLTEKSAKPAHQM